MAVTLTEVLTGLGSFSADLKTWDPEVWAKLQFGAFVRFYEGERLDSTWLLLTRSKWGMRFGGVNLEYLLGFEDTGSIIEDREWLAGNNKLSNPGAELDLLDWRPREDSNWVAATNAPRTGAKNFYVSADPDADDILQSDESREAAEGQEYSLTIWAKRLAGTTGILRGRMVCEGKFDTPNLLVDPTFTTGWTDTSEFPADVDVLDPTARIGPCTQPQWNTNPRFESGSTGWTDVGGLGGWTIVTAEHHDGTHSVRHNPVGAGAIDKYQNAIFVDLPAGTHMRAEGFVEGDSLPDGEAWLEVEQNDGVGGPSMYTDSPHAVATRMNAATWYLLEQNFELQEGQNFARVRIVITDHTTGDWYFDNIRLLKIRGNTCSLKADESFQVTPEKSYSGFFAVTADDEMEFGTLKVVATYVPAVSTPRSDLVVEVGSLDMDPDHRETLLEFNLRPPSGYDDCYLTLVGVDIWGGSFIVSHGRVTADTDTLTFDESWTDDTAASYTQFWPDYVRVCPAGTERVHVEIVAEEGSGGWVVDDIDFHRLGATSTEEDVVDALLVHQQTSDEILPVGTINGPDTIPFDLHVLNQTNRGILKHFSRAVVTPPREWRVNPDTTFDWGTAEELFTDHPDVIFREGDVYILNEPDVEESAVDQVERVKVIGADRPSVGQLHHFVTGEATNPNTLVDAFGHDIERSRIIEDSTVDFGDYATSRARYEADLAADPKESLRLTLSDPRTLGRWDNGDWLYFYLPLAGIEDASNEQQLRGETVWPKQRRCITRQRTPDKGWRCELVLSPTETVDITDKIDWSSAMTCEIEVGDLPTEAFAPDPQGAANGNQFLRARASMPR